MEVLDGFAANLKHGGIPDWSAFGSSDFHAKLKQGFAGIVSVGNFAGGKLFGAAALTVRVAQLGVITISK